MTERRGGSRVPDTSGSDLLMLTGLAALCADCGDERVFVPADDAGTYCCTACDAAVFMVTALPSGRRARSDRVA
jgi:hypothetical protein